MTYKDFVAKAVIAMLSNPRVTDDSNYNFRNHMDEVVEAAYTYAYLKVQLWRMNTLLTLKI